MKILLVHNYYQQPGGEDSVFHAEKEMLLQAGHDVVTYTRHNDEIARYSLTQRMLLPIETIWAQHSCREIEQLIEKEQPEVAHFHNTFPLISPAAYHVCKRMGVPVVQTLHNFRILCPAATFFREGNVCEECIDHTLLRSVRYGCYRGSRLATTTVAAMLKVHRIRQTWMAKVDAYICLSEFQRKKLAAAGLPIERTFVKQNFVSPDPRVHALASQRESAVFVGRLSSEKGLFTLFRAWGKLKQNTSLRILGDGPLRFELEQWKRNCNLTHVCLEGHRPHADVVAALRSARFLLFPSEWYETFGLIAIEAFACSTPVIASGQGAMAEIVDDGRTGLHFKPGNAVDLASKVEWAWTHPAEMEAMGRAARSEYEAKYTAEHNHEMLMEIYQHICRQASYL